MFTTPPLCQRTPRLEWRRVSAIRVWVHLFHDLLLFVQEVALRGFICSCWLACGIAIDPFIPSRRAYTGEILNIRQCTRFHDCTTKGTTWQLCFEWLGPQGRAPHIAGKLGRSPFASPVPTTHRLPTHKQWCRFHFFLLADRF